MPIRLALKVDVDTDRGTREGIPNLVADCQAVGAPACFLFSLGPDQTGRAITRIFRPGFFQKVSRTSVVEIYGVRTLLNGTRPALTCTCNDPPPTVHGKNQPATRPTGWSCPRHGVVV